MDITTRELEAIQKQIADLKCMNKKISATLEEVQTEPSPYSETQARIKPCNASLINSSDDKDSA